METKNRKSEGGQERRQDSLERGRREKQQLGRGQTRGAAGARAAPLPAVAERRLSRLQERDRAPRMPPLPPRPPHTTPLLSESEPGDSPALLPPLLLLLVPRSPLVCPLDSLGHCCALMQAGPSSSHRLGGGWAAGGGAGQGAGAAAAAGLQGDRASEPGPGPGPAAPSEGEGRAGDRAASLAPSPPPPHGRRSGPADIMGLR